MIPEFVKWSTVFSENVLKKSEESPWQARLKVVYYRYRSKDSIKTFGTGFAIFACNINKNERQRSRRSQMTYSQHRLNIKRLNIQNQIKERIKKIYGKNIEINLPLVENINHVAVVEYIAIKASIRNGMFEWTYE